MVGGRQRAEDEDYREAEKREHAAWRSSMLGRRLKAPQISRCRLSLPEWLARSAKNTEALRAPRTPKTTAKGRLVSKPATGGFQQVTPAGQPKASAISPPGETSAMGGSTSSESTSRPISQELDRRRQLHPRLRWPRLQRNVDPVRTIGEDDDGLDDDAESFTPTSTGIILRRYDDFTGEFEENGEDLQKYLGTALLEEDEKAEVVIGDGSLFFKGSEEKVSCALPSWNSLSSYSGGLGLYGGLKSHLQSRDSLAPSSSMETLTESRVSTASTSSILPRVRPHAGPISGSTSTLNSSSQVETFPLMSLESENEDKRHNLESKGDFLGFPGFPVIQSGGPKSKNRSSSKSSASRASASRRGNRKAPSGPTAEDEKWFLRQAPVSHLMARSARGADTGKKDAHSSIAAGASAGAAGGRSNTKAELSGFVDFENWGLDDAYLVSLFSTSSASDLSRIRRLNLAENRLTEKGIDMLTSSAASLSTLKTINLGGNQLGERGCLAVAKLLSIARPKLSELELADNAMGDYACQAICETLESFCRGIKVLGLGSNNVGVTELGGTALEQLISGMADLQALDLHWNQLHGDGATHLCQGLYDNACSIAGKLRRLDLSWNRLGLECKDSQRSATSRVNKASSMTGGFDQVCHCATCWASQRTWKMLASVFQEGQTLFHVDLSYNGLSTNACNILADGLRSNHSLFGLHLMGNAACVDDLGFVVPRTTAGKDESEQGDENEFENDLKLNRIVRSVPQRFKKLKDRNAHQSAGNEASCSQTSRQASWTSVQRNVDRCWICENWRNYDISYSPGFSGGEETAEEVTSVNAFFNIDGFRKPTVLTRCEEVYNRKNFEGRMTGNIKQRLSKAGTEDVSSSSRKGLVPRATLKDIVPQLPNGRVVRFIGSRVLPPTTESLEVVFQVNNDKIVVALDLPIVKLPRPKVILPEPSVVTSKATRTQRGSCDSVATLADTKTAEAKEVHEVNLLSMGINALESFEKGSGNGLCILEDPAKRGEVSVFPRRALDAPPPVPPPQWTFESSSFQDYVRDTDERWEECFDLDWRHSKLDQILNQMGRQEGAKEFLRPKYKQIIAAYHQAAFSNFHDCSHAVWMSMIPFREVMQMHDPGYAPEVSGNAAKAKASMRGWLFDGQFLALTDVDTIFVAANVFAPEATPNGKREFKTLPQNGLARFQFFEALVRIIARRFFDGPCFEDTDRLLQEFFEISRFGEPQLKLRQSLHECLFTEECCLVYRENMAMLEALFKHYKKRHGYPGRPQTFTYSAWLKLLEDCEATESGLTSKDLGLAFALGKEARVDEVSSYRHMELSLGEFFVCLGAVVRLRDDFDRDFFGDMLSDFFTQNLAEAHHRADKQAPDTSVRGIMSDPAVANVISLVARIFADADEDGSGFLDIREFRRSLNQQQVLEQIQNAGIEISDFNVLFKQLDSDRSGDVTLEEFIEGFIKMKIALRGMTRAVAYLRRVFAEKDADDSGTLNLEEFQNLCTDDSVKKKLQAMGITVCEMGVLFEDMVADCAEEQADPDVVPEVDADRMIAAFLRMRDPDLGSKRALNFLRQVYHEADVDRSGGLGRDEYKKAFTTDRVTQKLKKFGLKAPDWLGIFDILDIDGDGQLSLDELLQGVNTIWEAELQQKLKHDVHDYAVGCV